MQDDRSELDIEFVTPGTSIVNDTINYTSHPSINSNGTKIPNATVSIPLKDTLDEYKTHRFDCDAVKGVRYYLDNKLMHTDTHNVPKAGGSLQLKLWADGNKWWSGLPSKTDVFLKVKSITAYYNTTGSLTNEKWTNRCAREKKQCQAVTAIHSYNTKPATCIGSGCVGDASSKSHTSSSIVFKPVTSPQKSPSARRSLKIWLLAAWCLVVLFTVAR